MKSKILTIKEIQNLLEVSLNTASRINKDIRIHFGLKTKITVYHFETYFNMEIKGKVSQNNPK